MNSLTKCNLHRGYANSYQRHFDTIQLMSSLLFFLESVAANWQLRAANIKVAMSPISSLMQLLILEQQRELTTHPLRTMYAQVAEPSACSARSLSPISWRDCWSSTTVAPSALISWNQSTYTTVSE